jgi:hypothetical protein
MVRYGGTQINELHSGQPRHKARPCPKNNQCSRAGGVAQVEEGLPSQYKAELSPQYCQKKLVRPHLNHYPRVVHIYSSSYVDAQEED